MYPISTLLSQGSLGNAFSRLKAGFSEDLQNSNLIYLNQNSLDYQFYDIAVPYLILYEAVDTQADYSSYMEFCESGNLRISSPYSEYIKRNRRLHSHDFFEITYVLSGRLTLQIEDESIVYDAGECCVCNKNIHHLEVMDENTELFLLLLKEDFIRELLADRFQSDRPQHKDAGGNIFGHFFAENRSNPFYDAKVYADYRSKDPALREGFLYLINRMIEELMSDHLGKSFMLRALICRFLELMETSPSFSSQIHTAKLSREEELVHSIAQAYRKRKSIMSRSEVEKLTGYCSDHVERIIKRHTGMTLLEYGRLYLMQKAENMLTETDKSISDICEELGYSNRTYFNRIFRERYGLTPSDFRKEKASIKKQM